MLAVYSFKEDEVKAQPIDLSGLDTHKLVEGLGNEKEDEEFRNLMSGFNKGLLTKFWKKADERMAGRSWAEVMEDEKREKEEDEKRKEMCRNFQLID